jgi:hypothetical protein
MDGGLDRQRISKKKTDKTINKSFLKGLNKKNAGFLRLQA